MCITYSLHRFKPGMELESDMEPFIVPGLPEPIVLTRAQAPPVTGKSSSSMERLVEKMVEVDSKSYGTIMNSFLELEEAYVKHHTEVNGKKTWHVGPLSLCMNRDIDQKLVMTRGKRSSIDPQECVDWLNTKAESSVLYVCFGSVIKFAATQIAETAAAIESSSFTFIWVVKSSEVLMEGFEERIKEKGMVIRGWAPQVVIMGHPAVGGFVTHCGWNSALEGISSGLPMITWPGFADQFYNEKLITQVLKVGVEVGVKRWVNWQEEVAEVMEREAIEDAIGKVMGNGEESREMRRRAKVLGDMARKAIGEGGSSFLSLGSLMEELDAIRKRDTAY